MDWNRLSQGKKGIKNDAFLLAWLIVHLPHIKEVRFTMIGLCNQSVTHLSISPLHSSKPTFSCLPNLPHKPHTSKCPLPNTYTHTHTHTHTHPVHTWIFLTSYFSDIFPNDLGSQRFLLYFRSFGKTSETAISDSLISQVGNWEESRKGHLSII